MAKKNKRKIHQNLAKKRQKSAAREKQRRKARSTNRGSMGISRTALRDAPVHEVMIGKSIAEQGMGHVVVSRKLDAGLLAVGVFLVDGCCMGVKDSFFQIMESSDYSAMQEQFTEPVVKKATVAHARKLVDGAVAYARDLGFEPGGKFSDAYVLLEAVDPEEYTKDFTFGRDGKPFFMPGPGDTPAKCRQILKKLEAKCGPDGYEHIDLDSIDEAELAESLGLGGAEKADAAAEGGGADDKAKGESTEGAVVTEQGQGKGVLRRIRSFWGKSGGSGRR